MRTRVRRALLFLIGALTLGACATRVRIKESELLVAAGPTLELFWKFASLQVRDPAIASRLLNLDPQDTAKTLDSLGVGFGAYQQKLAQEAQVHPIVLFLPHDADPVQEARRHGLAITPWPQFAPPALLSGPEVDTLILYQPLTSAGGEPGKTGPVVRTRIAS